MSQFDLNAFGSNQENIQESDFNNIFQKTIEHKKNEQSPKISSIEIIPLEKENIFQP